MYIVKDMRKLYICGACPAANTLPPLVPSGDKLKLFFCRKKQLTVNWDDFNSGREKLGWLDHLRSRAGAGAGAN